MNKLLRQAFTLNLRSLALCRIATGLLVIVDLIVRCGEFRLHYTDLGMLPRWALLERQSPGILNIHLLSGAWTYEGFVFLLHSLVAVAVALGYRTRWSTILLWYFQHALMQRNYLVNNGGDGVLVCLLFWAMFLPWGTYASLDALAGKSSAERPTHVYTFASVCFVSQVLLMYWVSVFHKMEPTWLTGQTVYYTFLSDLYSRPTRVLIQPHTTLMETLTYGTLVWEVLGPALFICPWPFVRRFALIGFAVMHLGFGFFLRLGIFAFSPQLNFIALWPIVGELRCPAILRRWATRLNDYLKTPRPSPYGHSLTRNWTAVLVFLLIHSVLQGIGNTNQPQVRNRYIPTYLDWIGPWTGLNQRWALFINVPAIADGWLLVDGRLADGTDVDLFQGRDPFRWDKPVEVSESHTMFRWPTPVVQIVSQSWLQPLFVQALAQDWNDHHAPERKVVTARLYFLFEPSLADFEDSPPTPQLLHTWTAL